MKRRSFLGSYVALGVALGAASSAHAAAEIEVLPSEVLEQVRSVAAHPVTLMALRTQNVKHGSLSQQDIDQLDRTWREETEAESQPLIAQLLGSPLSSYLTRIMARSAGLFTEVFVIDSKGLNVGQSSITSDYWQGDEAKWLKTFAVGPDALFLDEEEFHEATRTRRRQLSLTIVDPETGASIGAITAEINMDELERRNGKQG